MVAVCEVALFKVIGTLEVLEAKHHSINIEAAAWRRSHRLAARPHQTDRLV